MDYSITSLGVQDVAGVNSALQPAVTRRVTFYVGQRGPFYLTYALADYTHDKVITDVLAQVASLKALDAGVGVQ
jgi:hypothetical protein